MTEHNHAVTDEQARMHALVTQLSAYIEQYHGGWVRFISFDDDVLKVQMGGACDGCSLSQMTLHGWIKGTVSQFFPEIKNVIAI